MLDHLPDTPSIGSVYLVYLFGAQMAGQLANPEELIFQDYQTTMTVQLIYQTLLIFSTHFRGFRTSAGNLSHQ